MKLNRRFNHLQKDEYFSIIENHKQYTDFNTLGVYRSLLENKNLGLEEKIAVRDFAHQHFQKILTSCSLKTRIHILKCVPLETNLPVVMNSTFGASSGKTRRKSSKKNAPGTATSGSMPSTIAVMITAQE